MHESSIYLLIHLEALWDSKSEQWSLFNIKQDLHSHFYLSPAGKVAGTLAGWKLPAVPQGPSSVGPSPRYLRVSGPHLKNPQFTFGHSSYHFL